MIHMVEKMKSKSVKTMKSLASELTQNAAVSEYFNQAILHDLSLIHI